ncbi:MAG: hypothetical protein OEM16_15280, partial [Myxococcales bacterium]|nr:hypothetical protein [Myxococcales bacterium]
MSASTGDSDRGPSHLLLENSASVSVRASATPAHRACVILARRSAMYRRFINWFSTTMVGRWIAI